MLTDATAHKKYSSSINYHDLLISPLKSYHGKIIKTFDDLPKNGKAWEIMKRIGLAVIAPFAYLTLGFIALIGLAIPDKTEILDKAFDPKKLYSLVKSETENLEYNFLSDDEITGRFSDIKCPRETAIKVGDGYIHANKVSIGNRGYIATQAPLPLELEKFWKMSFEHSSLIVDLTNENDQTRGVDPYYPDKVEQPVRYGEITVTLKSQKEITQGLHLCQYEIFQKGKSKLVERLHFTAWEDFEGADMSRLNNLVETIEKKVTENADSTPIIHCRAGVGRTGTLITILSIRQELKRNRKKFVKSPNQEIAKLILQGRKNRGPFFVQSDTQFELIAKYAKSYAEEQLVFIEDFVSSFLHPYLTGQITREAESENRKAMIDLLLNKMSPSDSIERDQIEEIAFNAYLEKAALGLYMWNQEIEKITANSPEFTYFVKALKEALPKDFPGREMAESTLMEKASEALISINKKREIEKAEHDEFIKKFN